MIKKVNLYPNGRFLNTKLERENGDIGNKKLSLKKTPEDHQGMRRQVKAIF